MTNKKSDIFCSPTKNDLFVTCGSDLKLFKIHKIKEGQSVEETDNLPASESEVHKLSDEYYATSIKTNSSSFLTTIKCVDWYPGSNPDDLLALGLNNGVVLTSFKQTKETAPGGLAGREFTHRHGKAACTCLAWNPVVHNHLAIANERYRTEASILIWDVQQTSFATQQQTTPDRRLNTIYHKPLYELAQSESVFSLCWIPSEGGNQLVSGFTKGLKIFDVRDSTKPIKQNFTKSVYGLCVDPYFNFRLASYSEGHVTFWDARNFEKPVLTLNEEAKAITKLQWCPTRAGLLASSSRDSVVVKLYDIHHAAVSITGSGDEIESDMMERITRRSSPPNVTTFAWQPSHERKMITVSTMGHLKQATFDERISLSWSASLGLSWASGQKTDHYKDFEPAVEVQPPEDISEKIKRRALNNYGLSDEKISESEDVVKDRQLKSLWSWIELVTKLGKEGKLRETTGGGSRAKGGGFFSSSDSNGSGGGGLRYHGVKAAIKGEDNASVCTKSKCISKSWPDLDWYLASKVYTSRDREYAMQLCGWEFEQNGQTFEEQITSLEMSGNYERAAATALFNLRIKQAVETLNRGAKNSGSGEGKDLNLSVIAMAISGFTDDKNKLWREMCSSLCTQLKNPYLRAMFGFLTTTDQKYYSVLDEHEMLIQDRVAFACQFLDDMDLARYMDKLTNDVIKLGSLDGILLTGLSKDGVDLLQKYIDLTGDIQTPSLVYAHTSSHSFGNDDRVQQWKESYRSLLDTWRLWHQRAKFDVLCQASNSSSQPQEQIFMRCNYCGKSLSGNYLDAAGRSRTAMVTGNYGPYGSNRTKITCCQHCRKPMPRCSLCLYNMGTPSVKAKQSLGTSPENKEDQKEQKMAEFGSWFTWCQSCRHGGHAMHMNEWFKSHGECPVTACNCRCMSVDAVGNPTTFSSSPKVMEQQKPWHSHSNH